MGDLALQFSSSFDIIFCQICPTNTSKGYWIMDSRNVFDFLCWKTRYFARDGSGC
jgi:hypothetical protein